MKLSKKMLVAIVGYTVGVVAVFCLPACDGLIPPSSQINETKSNSSASVTGMAATGSREIIKDCLTSQPEATSTKAEVKTQKKATKLASKKSVSHQKAHKGKKLTASKSHYSKNKHKSKAKLAHKGKSAQHKKSKVLAHKSGSRKIAMKK